MLREAIPHARLRLLIVNADDEAALALEEAARQTDRFWPIERMSDARFALQRVWECIQSRPEAVPDVVLTDLRAGGIGGVQLTRELRRYTETRRMLIAFIASNGGPLDQDAAENAGADFFVMRPKTPQELPAILLKIVQRCSALGPLPARMLN